MEKKKLKHHTHGNHIPKVLKKKISWIERLASCTKLTVGRAYNHRHRDSPGNIVFQREIENGVLKLKGFTNDGSIDLFVIGNKTELLKAI